MIAVVLVAFAVIAILVVIGALNFWFLPWMPNEAETSGAVLGEELRRLAHLDTPGQIASIIAALGVILLMLVLLVLEARSAGRQKKPLLVSSTDLGVLDIDPDSVLSLAELTGSANESVVDLRCRLKTRGKTPPNGPDHIVITCEPRLDVGANVPTVRDNLQSTIKDTVESLTGLAVDHVHLSRVRYTRPASGQRVVN